MPDFAPPYPKTILCATDLSSRCDRALDRAAMVTGAPSRGALMEMLLGSTAQRLVDGMPPTAELP